MSTCTCHQAIHSFGCPLYMGATTLDPVASALPRPIGNVVFKAGLRYRVRGRITPSPSGPGYDVNLIVEVEP